MHIDKGQLKAINIYLLYQITYPEDLNIVLKRQKKKLKGVKQNENSCNIC